MFKSSDYLLITEIARKLAKSTCKLYVYGQEKIGVPQSLGSSILLELNNNYYCVSNAHVLGDENIGKAFVLNQFKKSMTIGGFFHTTKLPPNGKREDDVIDVSVVKLQLTAVDWLTASGYLFLPMEKIESDFEPSLKDLMLMVGYPASKTKTIISQKSLTTSPFYFVTKPNFKDLTEMKFSSADHIFADYTRKQIHNPRTGKNNTGPLPHGMSGGGLYHIQKNVTGNYDVYLIGIMSEYIVKHSLVVSTKIGLVLDIIKQKIDPDIAYNGLFRHVT